MESNSSNTNSPSDTGKQAAQLSLADRRDQPKRFHLDFDDRAAFHLVNFYEPETVEAHYFRWSEPVAMVRLDVPASDYEVTIETALLRCGGMAFPFKIYWNDQVISKKNIRIDGGKIIFVVSREMFIRNDEQRLTFSCKPLNAEKGRRQLGLPVKWVRLEQTGSTDPEFSNPTKTRSRFWRRDAGLPNLRKMVGLKSPSPILPIWEMKLPNSSTSLRGQTNEAIEDNPENDLVIVSSVEINSRHGTGLLIQYMFEDFSQITTVSSQRCFHGDRVRSAKHFEVPFQELDRFQIYEMVLQWFKNAPPKRAYVVPYYKTELLVAIALSDLFGTEICLHIMDDQCLYEDEIPFPLMEEAMSKSGLIFVISPEMRDAYNERFHHRIFILPPVVPEAMIRKDQGLPVVVDVQGPGPGRKRFSIKNVLQRFRKQPKTDVAKPRGIIIGNIWNERWLAKLQETIRDSGYEVDWFSNNPDAIMLSSQKDQLTSSGIHLKSPLWGDDLVKELRQRPYAIMPSGMLGRDEERESLARLSLPSRLPFVMSVSNIPIVVLGSRETAAAKYVQRFNLGAVIDYEADQFKASIDRIMKPEVQEDIRSRANKLSSTFSARNLSNWLDESIQMNQPADNRFEVVFSDKVAEHVDRPSFSRRTNWNKDALWQMLGRLKKQGVVPKQIIDVGSGDGAWSWAASHVYPDANYVLIEPLLSRYSKGDREKFERSLNEPEVFELTLSDQRGETEFGDDMNTVDGSTSNSFEGLSTFARQSKKILTLDQLAEESQFGRQALLKIDARFSECIVVAGGIEFIKNNVDTVLLTFDLSPKHASAKSYSEFLMLMDSLDFQLIDESEAKRCPKTEILLSKNLLFVKREITQKKLAA